MTTRKRMVFLANKQNIVKSFWDKEIHKLWVYYAKWTLAHIWVYQILAKNSVKIVSDIYFERHAKIIKF